MLIRKNKYFLIIQSIKDIDLKNINMSDIKEQITKLLSNKKLVTNKKQWEKRNIEIEDEQIKRSKER